MFEISIIIVTLAALLFIEHKNRLASVRTTTAVTVIPEKTRKLNIEGTEVFPLEGAGFFKGYGIPVQQLCDARCFRVAGSFKDFPNAVSRAILALYADGTATGADVMRLIHKGRELRPDEAVYFAMTRTGPNKNVYNLYAFIDHVR
jgi:hypothetical protein